MSTVYGDDRAPKNNSLARLLIICATILGGLAVLGLAVGLPISNAISSAAPPVTVETQQDNTQVIESLKRTEEVSLLSLGIQGIEQRTQQQTVFGQPVPWTDRSKFLQYSFNAKLGVDGSKVEIREGDDGSIVISIPEFIFIGHDDAKFELISEQNGELSFTTPEIDELEMTNAILNDSAEQTYLEQHEQQLREQVESFYRGIVNSVDPTLNVVFEYQAGN